MGNCLCSRIYYRLRYGSCGMILEFITFVVGIALGYVLGNLLLNFINTEGKVIRRHDRYWFYLHYNPRNCTHSTCSYGRRLVGLKNILRITNVLQKVNTNRWEKYYFTLPKSRDIINTNLICNQVNHRLYYPNARKVVRNIYALNLGWA